MLPVDTQAAPQPDQDEPGKQLVTQKSNSLDNNLIEQLSLQPICDVADLSRVVWAKVKGYPWWPAQVLPQSEAQTRLAGALQRKDHTVAVMFFGTREVAWMCSKDICAWKVGMEQKYYVKGKTSKFSLALVQVKELLQFGKKRKAPEQWWCKPPAPPRKPKPTPEATVATADGDDKESLKAEGVAVGKDEGAAAGNLQEEDIDHAASQKLKRIKVEAVADASAQGAPLHTAQELGSSAGLAAVPAGPTAAEALGAAKARLRMFSKGGDYPAPFIWPEGEPDLPDEAGDFQLPGFCFATRRPHYEHLRTNIWVSKPRPKRLPKDQVSSCNCRAVPENAEGCGDNCLNRLSFLHCDMKTCPAGKACRNRPFHHLRPPKMDMFLTENRGWGVRAGEPIHKGTFVVEYCGEVIDEVELRRRMDSARELGEQHYYIMELQSGLFIDARSKGNLARLLNSSCAPNCETQKWHDAATGEVRIGIFTTQDILPGEELTYDYKFEHYGLAAAFGSFRCMCGAPNCRGTMDVNPDKRRDNGRRLEVYWDGDGVYYRGTVIGYHGSSRRHTVVYDDGETEKVQLDSVPHRWLDPEASPHSSARIPSPPPPGSTRGPRPSPKRVQAPVAESSSSSGAQSRLLACRTLDAALAASDPQPSTPTTKRSPTPPPLPSSASPHAQDLQKPSRIKGLSPSPTNPLASRIPPRASSSSPQPRRPTPIRPTQPDAQPSHLRPASHSQAAAPTAPAPAPASIKAEPTDISPTPPVPEATSEPHLPRAAPASTPAASNATPSSDPTAPAPSGAATAPATVPTADHQDAQAEAMAGADQQGAVKPEQQPAEAHSTEQPDQSGHAPPHNVEPLQLQQASELQHHEEAVAGKQDLGAEAGQAPAGGHTEALDAERSAGRLPGEAVVGEAAAAAKRVGGEPAACMLKDPPQQGQAGEGAAVSEQEAAGGEQEAAEQVASAHREGQEEHDPGAASVCDGGGSSGAAAAAAAPGEAQQAAAGNGAQPQEHPAAAQDATDTGEGEAAKTTSHVSSTSSQSACHVSTGSAMSALSGGQVASAAGTGSPPSSPSTHGANAASPVEQKAAPSTAPPTHTPKAAATALPQRSPRQSPQPDPPLAHPTLSSKPSTPVSPAHTHPADPPAPPAPSSVPTVQPSRRPSPHLTDRQPQSAPPVQKSRRTKRRKDPPPPPPAQVRRLHHPAHQPPPVIRKGLPNALSDYPILGLLDGPLPRSSAHPSPISQHQFPAGALHPSLIHATPLQHPAHMGHPAGLPPDPILPPGFINPAHLPISLASLPHYLHASLNSPPNTAPPHPSARHHLNDPLAPNTEPILLPRHPVTHRTVASTDPRLASPRHPIHKSHMPPSHNSHVPMNAFPHERSSSPPYDRHPAHCLHERAPSPLANNAPAPHLQPHTAPSQTQAPAPSAAAAATPHTVSALISIFKKLESQGTPPVDKVAFQTLQTFLQPLLNAPPSSPVSKPSSHKRSHTSHSHQPGPSHLHPTPASHPSHPGLHPASIHPPLPTPAAPQSAPQPTPPAALAALKQAIASQGTGSATPTSFPMHPGSSAFPLASAPAAAAITAAGSAEAVAAAGAAAAAAAAAADASPPLLNQQLHEQLMRMLSTQTFGRLSDR